MKCYWDDLGSTLEEIAQVEGLTRQRVKQIEQCALSKLRLLHRGELYEIWCEFERIRPDRHWREKDGWPEGFESDLSDVRRKK